MVKDELVGVETQNCKQRAKTETMATTERTAAMRATTTRSITRMTGARMLGRKEPYHHGDENQNCGFCVSKLESTTGTML